jgi:hypothetical protein
MKLRDQEIISLQRLFFAPSSQENGAGPHGKFQRKCGGRRSKEKICSDAFIVVFMGKDG